MDDFIFSQSSLQDYLDCPRRFELRYQLKIQWPGNIWQEPAEVRRSAMLGNRFHLLCQQLFTGVPEDLIRQSLYDETLLEWWNNFITWKVANLFEGQFYPEMTLHTHIAGQQVVAKYDLLQIQADKARIYDWKTSAVRYPHAWLENRVQTTLYPLVLCLAGENLSINSIRFSPENVEMAYWFASYPQNPEVLPYSRYQFEEDRQRIENLIQQIITTAPGQFEMTNNERHCSFCNYRSLCERHPELDLPEAETQISFENALDHLLTSFEDQLNERLEP